LDYSVVFEKCGVVADPERAVKMSAYVRNLFPFLGLPASRRRGLSKEFLCLARKQRVINWNFVNMCWEKECEFQYLA